MNLNSPIGGYFELELNNLNTVYHDNAIAVNSGRNGLEYILRVNRYSKIYIPYYTCDVILQPIKKLNIDYEFYSLNGILLPKKININEKEALLIVNYFGLLNSKIPLLQKKYKNLIIDNSQAFYSFPIEHIPSFYSPRKFFGLPDGGFVYSDKILEQKLNYEKSADKMAHLVKRIEEGAESAYYLFQQNDSKLNNLPLRLMSKLTDRLMRNINFEFAKKRRNENFHILHKALKYENELTEMIENTKISGPMVYPFLNINNKKVRQHLIERKIYVAKYWPNVMDWINQKNVFEKYLYENLIPLPIDQRYANDEMIYMIKIIKELEL